MGRIILSVHLAVHKTTHLFPRKRKGSTDIQHRARKCMQSTEQLEKKNKNLGLSLIYLWF